MKEEVYRSAARRRTDSIIRRAFIDLMLNSSSEISVRELCEAADIDRATFYRYYPDIASLHDTLTNELYEKLFTDIAVSDFNPYEHDHKYNIEIPVLKGLNVIKENQKLCTALLRDCSPNNFLSRVKTDYRAYFSSFLKTYGYLGECTEYLNVFALQGMLAIVSRWVNGGCVTEPEKVASMISKATNAAYEVIKDFESSVYKA